VIAKGNTHGNGGKLAAYMVTGKDGERAELYQLQGFASGDIRSAFRDVHLMADGGKVTKPFFHAQVRNPDGEELTRAQWLQVADRIETKLGYSGQARAIAFHTDEKTGHEHMHVAWSRIDEDTLQAKPLPFFKLRLKELCRELETELDLTPVRNERPRPEIFSASRAEQEQSRRLATDGHGIRDSIRDAYDHSDNGKAFAAALADQGLTLCQGERRDFVALDQAGGLHVLGKRLLGDSAAAVRQKLGDLEREAVPTVDQARERLADRPAPELQAATARQVEPTEAERAAMFARFDQRMQEQRANPTHTYHALHETHRQVAEQLRKEAQPEPPKQTDAEILAEIRRQMERARERGRER
jgi:hypothetical protein